MHNLFKLAPAIQLVLASASPRRQELLATLGLSFIIQPSSEEPLPKMVEAPEDYATRCALAKAGHIFESNVNNKEKNGEIIVLAADTIVIKDNRIMGKPKDEEEAYFMLDRLNGAQHSVITACCLKSAGFIKQFSCESRVFFHFWPKEVLRNYVASGDPLDKAGAYGIQGPGAFLIDKIEGSWTNVAGLPLAHVASALLELKIITVA